jgi:bacterioferritin-associated ferredoxin
LHDEQRTERTEIVIICQCMGITETAITEVIRDGASTVREITRRTGAGRCCAPCREEIAAILCRHCPSVSE